MTYWLTILLLGSVVYQVGPMSKTDCSARKATVEAQIVAWQGPRPIYEGRTLTPADVSVRCRDLPITPRN